MIHLPRETPGLTRWLLPTIELFRVEYAHASPGRAAILARLAEIACIQAIRIWIEQTPTLTQGWLRASKDPRIALALQAIHRAPGLRWTVGFLAQQAGMSRSVFASRFKALVGESPMEYVSRWRMHRAIRLLERKQSSLKEVAAALGYRSACAFRTKFKSHFGRLPSDHAPFASDEVTHRRVGP